MDQSIPLVMTFLRPWRYVIWFVPAGKVYIAPLGRQMWSREVTATAGRNGWRYKCKECVWWNSREEGLRQRHGGSRSSFGCFGGGSQHPGQQGGLILLLDLFPCHQSLTAGEDCIALGWEEVRRQDCEGYQGETVDHMYYSHSPNLATFDAPGFFRKTWTTPIHAQVIEVFGREHTNFLTTSLMEDACVAYHKSGDTAPRVLWLLILIKSLQATARDTGKGECTTTIKTTRHCPLKVETLQMSLMDKLLATLAEPRRGFKLGRSSELLLWRWQVI